MVSSVSELFATVRANPFIDGLGYFVEVETERPVSSVQLQAWTERMRADFCEHSSASRDGSHVLGLDFHEHICTQGEEGNHFLGAMEALLSSVEASHGIHHICVEFQFDFATAKKQVSVVDELLRP